MSWRSEPHRPEHPDEDNEAMARLLERDADEAEQRDLLLDMRDRNLPIFAALAWAERPAPRSEPLQAGHSSGPGHDDGPQRSLPRSALGPSSPACTNDGSLRR